MRHRISFRLAGLALGFVALFFVFGCLGGGSGKSAFGPGSAPDTLAITATINTFMRAMVSGNTTEANRLLSSRLQTVAASGNVIASLTLYDFGADINNPADDGAWTFLIRQGGINQTSESFATVVADGITPDGKLLQVAFELVKIESAWFIDYITLIDADGNSYDMPSMFPMNPGDEWTYTLTPTGSQGGGTKVRRIVGSQTELIDGKRVVSIYETTETASSLAALIQPGEPKGIRALFYPKKFRERYSSDGGVFYYGQDQSFNNNVPLQLVAAKGRTGTISTQTITLTVDGKTSTADVQITILPEEVMETPLKTLKVLPIDVFVTYREPYLFSYSREREIWYLAANIGLVGFQIFDPNDPTKPLYQSKVQEAMVSGTSYFPSTELATPTVLAVFPRNGAAEIASQTAIYADFSKALAALGVSSAPLDVTVAGQSIPGSITVATNRLHFQPIPALPEGTEVVVTISSTVRDIRGIALGQPYTWKFSTSRTAAPEVAPPSALAVLAVFPGSGTTGIAPQTFIYADFTQTLAPIDVSSAPLTVTVAGQSIPGTITVAENRLRFQPTLALPAEAEVVVTIASTVKDIRGFALAHPYTWKFNTTIHLNQAPSFVKGPDITVREDSGAFTQTGWATAITPGAEAEAGQNLTFQIRTEHPGLFAPNLSPAISSAGTLVFTTAPDAFGSTTVEISLRDDGGTSGGGNDVSASHTFIITVTPVNDTPVFAKGPNVTVNLTSGAQGISNWATGILPGPANEAGQTLQFLVVPSLPSLFLTPPTISPTGTLSFTPARSGTSLLSVQLSDNGGTADGGISLSPAQTFEITVFLPNQPPGFTKGPNIVMTPNEGEKIIDAWATLISPGHVEEAAQTLQFQVTNDRPDLFSGQPSIDATGRLSFIPYGIGVVTVSVNLKDNGGTLNGGQDQSATQTFTITLNSAPHKSVTWKRSSPFYIDEAGCAVVNDRVFVFGGAANDGGWLNRMEEYKPATNEWVDFSATYPFPGGKGRKSFGTAVHNNQIYLVGGAKQDGVGSDILRFNGSNWEDLSINLPSGTCEDFAVAVLNDKLYLIGGNDSGATALVYTLDLNPIGTSFSSVGSLQTARYAHAACVVDGKIVVAGGYNAGGTELNTAEVYDSGLNAWAYLAPMATERTEFVLLPSGSSVMAIGGSTSISSADTIEVLSSLAGTWSTQAQKLPESLYGHIGAIVDGRAMIFGGYNNDTWYNPRVIEHRDGQWFFKTVPQPLRKPGLVAYNEKLYLFGGEDLSVANTQTWEYDPQIHVWKQLNPMTSMGGYQYAAATVNNVIMSISADSSSLATMEFNPSTNSWQTRSTIPETPRSYLAGASLMGRLLVTGGLDDSSSPTDFLHAFTPGTNSWTTLAPMPVALYKHSAASINNRFLVLGGEFSETTVGEYDPLSNQWIEKTSSPFPHEKSSAVVCAGKVFVVGGYSSSGEDFTDRVLEFDPFTNAWNPAPTYLHWARQDTGAAVIGNQIYVIGGDNGPTLGYMEVGTVQ